MQSELDVKTQKAEWQAGETELMSAQKGRIYIRAFEKLK